MSDIEVLQQLQSCDLERMRAEKQLDELPEAKSIMDCRARRRELKGKQDEIVELADDAEAKLEALQREEQQVIEKINALQQQLDTTSDYRVTQSVTRDMQGQVKRQATLAGDVDAMLERQIKIDNFADQLSGMLADVDEKERAYTVTFKEKGGALKARIDELAAEHTRLGQLLAPETLARYERIRDEKGGIGLARLDGERCSACSTLILTGQLAKLRKGPAIAECPNCHRIMIVRDEED